jgi:hypothetical protein
MKPETMKRAPRKLNLLWLREKLESPKQWSVRDRDDIAFFIELKRRQLARTSERRQPLRRGREEFLAELEAAMDAYIRSRPGYWDDWSPPRYWGDSET